MRIISLLLSLMLFAVLATHFSPPDDWRSRLSEYVQKILEESRQRPLYYVAYESNSSVIDQYTRSLNVV